MDLGPHATFIIASYAASAFILAILIGWIVAEHRALKRKLADAGIDAATPDIARLDAYELGLVKLLAQFPRTVEAAATAREPHRIAFYLGDVAAAFHAWWNMGNDRPDARIILANDAELTATRLYLADGIGQVIRNGLHLMGVEALEEML